MHYSETLMPGGILLLLWWHDDFVFNHYTKTFMHHLDEI